MPKKNSGKRLCSFCELGTKAIVGTPRVGRPYLICIECRGPWTPIRHSEPKKKPTNKKKGRGNAGKNGKHQDRNR